MSWKIVETCRNPYFSKKYRTFFPCGQCAACKVMQRQEWAMRGRHELIEHKGKGTMITLSYDKEHLPKSGETLVKMNELDERGTLERKHVTDFLKRLRKKIEPEKIRYMGCGEYGPVTWRPHYHIIIFGREWNEWDGLKADEWFGEIWGQGKVFVSKKPMGENAIDYCVGYIRKKIGSLEGGRAYYEGNGRERPFLTTSKGIGREWGDKHVRQWAETGTVPYKGKDRNIPRAYIKRIRKIEGKTVKVRINGRFHYKVIESPEGKWSRVIRETLKRLKKEGYEREEEEGKLYIKQTRWGIGTGEKEMVEKWVAWEEKEESLIRTWKREYIENAVKRAEQREAREKYMTAAERCWHKIPEEIKRLGEGVIKKFREKREKAERLDKSLKERDIYGRRDKHEIGSMGKILMERYRRKKMKQIEREKCYVDEGKGYPIDWDVIFNSIPVKTEIDLMGETLWAK